MLILLDIDGVMVPANSWKKPEFLADGFVAFSSKSVLALNKIIKETNANIILTTSHKSSYSLFEWKEIFNVRGIYVDKIEKILDNNLNLNRKEEILNWFKNCKSNENFVIIDDDKSLNGLDDFIKERLIQTSSLVGLTDDLAENAIFILKQELAVI